MYSDGHEVDGSWVLRVYVTDLQVERSLRVKGELHIGGVMLRLVEDLGESDNVHLLSSLLSTSLYFRLLSTPPPSTPAIVCPAVWKFLHFTRVFLHAH
jgi:hypothetical protein